MMMMPTKKIKMLSQMFYLLSYLHHCAFTASPKEITVNNFASTLQHRPQFIKNPIQQFHSCGIFITSVHKNISKRKTAAVNYVITSSSHDDYVAVRRGGSPPMSLAPSFLACASSCAVASPEF